MSEHFKGYDFSGFWDDYDYTITFLAKNFEDFILGLCDKPNVKEE